MRRIILFDRLFNRRRRVFEELATEHLDGVLDAQGRERLQRILDDEPSWRTELSELEGATTLLRAMPHEAAPRSFALPYAPAPAQPASAPHGLRWLQAASATAALLLMALIVTDLATVEPGAPIFSASAEEERVAPESAAGGSAEMDASGDGSASALAPESATKIQAATDDESLSIAAALPEAEPGLAENPPGRTFLDWAVTVLGLTTAALALGLVALAWTARRNPA